MACLFQLAKACTKYKGDDRDYAKLVPQLRAVLLRDYRKHHPSNQYEGEVVTRTITTLQSALIPFTSQKGDKLLKFLQRTMWNNLRNVLKAERKHDKYTIRKQHIPLVRAGVTEPLENQLITDEAKATKLQWLWENIPSLPPLQQSVITLRLMDYTNREIATALNIELYNVKYHMQTARKILIERIKHDTEANVP